MQVRDMLYEGKAKKLFRTEDPSILLVEYKDSLTAFNARKKSSLTGKGSLTNRISADLLEFVGNQGVPTHFSRLVDDTCQLVRKVEIIPLELVIRNITAGSICRRLGVEEGIKLKDPLVEFYLKNDDLGDPLVTEDHILSFSWASTSDICTMKRLSLQVNRILKEFFAGLEIILVDLKLEFGRTPEGNIILADEISPDTCRLWDASTGEPLDKDRFRKDLGNVLGSYHEIWRRITGREKR